MVTLGQESRDKIIKGVDTLANAVKVTLGARGRNVVIEQTIGAPKITKDGVTVAKAVNPQDNLEMMGAQLLQEVANNVVREAGDGTSTATILSQAIINKGNEYLKQGINPVHLVKGIKLATTEVVRRLKDLSQNIETPEQLRQIATISANGDIELGNLIADLISDVGVDGVITIEQSMTTKTSSRKTDGVEINQPMLSPYFITNSEKAEAVLKNPLIAIINQPVAHFTELQPLLEKVVTSQRQLLLIVDEIEPTALHTIVMNKMRGNLNVIVCKSPSFGDERREILEDLAAYTGAEIFSPEKGTNLSTVTLSSLGSSEKVVSKGSKTIIIGGEGDTTERISAIKTQIEETEDNDKIKKRLANLTNGIAVISVGGETETEIFEKIDRVDDAINAVKSAIQEGYISGGGSTLKLIADTLKVHTNNEIQNKGVEIIRESIKEPFTQILRNAGIESNKTFEYGQGLDLDSGAIVDYFANGIIDPTKVTRVALENASSIGAIFLTTDCVISQ